MAADNANMDNSSTATQVFHGQHGIRQVSGLNGQFGGHLGVPGNSFGGVLDSFGGLNIGNSIAHPNAQLFDTRTYMAPNGHYVFGPMGPSGHMALDNYVPGIAPYLGAGPGHGQFSNYVGMPLMPFTPGRAGGVPIRNDRGCDVPGLENRRTSYSTNESTPATPFFGGVAQRGSGPRVAGLDRSVYTTPSPNQLALQGMDAAKGVVTSFPLDSTLDDMVKKEPAIPKAVPAVFTPPGQMKSLEQSLENRIPGNRNVYIRGLHPTTDDVLLQAYASRFGAVETSKAIIDTSTGACKGFGFAKFYDVLHSELCIRGFHRLGYEVGFARESFNSRLKAEGDEQSTNLYISNLPRNVGEVELASIFAGYEIISSKILRDSMGNSRGVGFARFSSRDVCDVVIEKYHGIPIGDEGLPMNIRYADTPAQKELKRITAERRQFRTNEYNIGAYGTSLVGYQPNVFAGQSQGHIWRRQGSAPAHIPPSKLQGASANSGGSSAAGSRGESGSHRRARTSSDAAVATPSTSNVSDEGLTVKRGPGIAGGSTQSSPSAKKGKKH